MNLLDIIILILVGGCLIWGIFRGVVREMSSIIGIGAGVYAAFAFYPQLAPHLENAIQQAPRLKSMIPDAGFLKIAAFLILFVGVFVFISLLGMLVRYLIQKTIVVWLDRVLGGIFGGIKGVLIVSVLLLALTSFLPKQSHFLKHSVLAPHIVRIPETLSRITPRPVQKQFDANMKEIRKFWNKHSRILQKQIEKHSPGL